MRLKTPRALLALTAVALLLTGCSAGADPVATALAAHGWDDLDGRELVETLEALPVDERPADLIASVRSLGVDVSVPDAEPLTVPIAEDFYLSIAPYRDQTHPCGFHSLTTCRGELAAEPMTIVVTDADTGAVVVDEQRTTADNGFVGVWLPRDGAFDVRVTMNDGATAATQVTTGADDPTCLTTLQVA